MSDGDFIKGLGARSSVIHAPAEAAKRPLSTDERALVGLIGDGSTIQEVLSRSTLPEARTVATLLGLRLKGLVAPGRRPGSVTFSSAQRAAAISRAAPAAAPVATPAMRLDEAALSEPVEIDEARKREILEFEARCSSPDLFAMLGVPPGTPGPECKKAYYELTRRFHPDRFFGKSLGSYKARIDRVFKRMTEAQQILTDATRRAEYLARHPELAAPAQATRPLSPLDEERAQERRARIKGHPYLAKRARLNDLVAHGRQALQKGEFSKAYNDFNLAAQIEPNDPEIAKLMVEAKKGGDRVRADSEYQDAIRLQTLGDSAAALGKLRAAYGLDPDNVTYCEKLARQLMQLGGEEALKEAHGVARRATEIAPRSADARLLFASVLVQVGLHRNAKREYELVLQLRPDDPVATE
ncbi:MAG: DnaJ domain-containing protein, partial [Myxococcales bacterium]